MSDDKKFSTPILMPGKSHGQRDLAGTVLGVAKKKKKSFHISLRRITSGTKWSFYMAVGHKPTSLFNLQVRI